MLTADVAQYKECLMLLAGSAAVVPILVEGLFRLLHAMVLSGEVYVACCTCMSCSTASDLD